MVSVSWDSKAREFLRKLPKEVAKRIFRKVDVEVKSNVEHYLEPVVNHDFSKIRVGDYRLFVDYDKSEDTLYIRSVRHRRDAYKR